jgi:hypothetical protein
VRFIWRSLEKFAGPIRDGGLREGGFQARKQRFQFVRVEDGGFDQQGGGALRHQRRIALDELFDIVLSIGLLSIGAERR